MPDQLTDRARKAAEEIISMAGNIDDIAAIIDRHMPRYESMRIKLSKTLEAHKDRIENLPAGMGKDRKRNYRDWLKYEIKEIEEILKEAAPCQEK